MIILTYNYEWAEHKKEKDSIVDSKEVKKWIFVEDEIEIVAIMARDGVKECAWGRTIFLPWLFGSLSLSWHLRQFAVAPSLNYLHKSKFSLRVYAHYIPLHHSHIQ